MARRIHDPEVRSCEACGARLERKRFASGRLEKRAKFLARKTCGLECRDELARRSVVVRPCVACGRDIPRADGESPSDYQSRVTCGAPECLRRRKPPRRCEVCEQAIYGRRRRVCGDECQAMLPIIAVPPRECEICGGTYTRNRYAGGELESWANYSRRRSCSDACRKQLEVTRDGTGVLYENRDPQRPGPRTLLARTCRDCDRFLPGVKFPVTRRDDRTYRGSECIACVGARDRAQMDDDRRDRQRTYHRRIENSTQATTVPVAHRNGNMWTGPELELVATRDDLTIGELAKMLGRTYYATRRARQKVRHEPRERWLAGVE